MKIMNIHDPAFRKYGRVLSLDAKPFIEAAQTVKMPDGEASRYVPTLPEFEALPAANVIRDELFGEMPAQVGYCWGYNHRLNALEWHKCSEINIALTDLILLLGELKDVEDGKYDSSRVEAFLLKKGESVEVYATTLHYGPIQTSAEGFRFVVALTEGTNTELQKKPADPLLFNKNKWLMAHVDNKELIEEGAFPGITGENYCL